MKRPGRVNRKWWIADVGIGCAGLLSARSLRRLKKGMRILGYKGQQVSYYVHLNA